MSIKVESTKPSFIISAGPKLVKESSFEQIEAYFKQESMNFAAKRTNIHNAGHH
jgi:hypothetical protein